MYLYSISELKVKYPNANYASHLNVISSCSIWRRRLDLLPDDPSLHSVITCAQSEATETELACVRKRQNNQENSAVDEKL